MEKNSSLILLQKLNTLSIEQRICLISLILSVKSKIPANILQGKTLTGKTFVIKLLAEIVGQDLLVFQLNNDSGLSLLTNQISPNFFIEKDAADEISVLLNQIKDFDDFFK
jgi:midasin (ATPase involved in ribosome maturation)